MLNEGDKSARVCSIHRCYHQTSLWSVCQLKLIDEPITAINYSTLYMWRTTWRLFCCLQFYKKKAFKHDCHCDVFERYRLNFILIAAVILLQLSEGNAADFEDIDQRRSFLGSVVFRSVPHQSVSLTRHGSLLFKFVKQGPKTASW